MKRLTLSAMALALAACASTPVMAQDPDAETLASVRERAPTDEVIYFVLPDRFANGDATNDLGGYENDRLKSGYDPTHKGFYHGGDLKGLTEQ